MKYRIISYCLIGLTSLTLLLYTNYPSFRFLVGQYTEIEQIEFQKCNPHHHNTIHKHFDIPIDKEEYKVFEYLHSGLDDDRKARYLNTTGNALSCSSIKELKRFIKDQDLLLDLMKKNMKSYKWGVVGTSRIGFNKDKTKAAYFYHYPDHSLMTKFKKNNNGKWEKINKEYLFSCRPFFKCGEF